jgi:hypothetical protein
MDYHKKIIEDLAKEFNLPKSKIDHVTKHFFSWQREKFIECDNVEYKWNYFGKFKIIQRRYDNYIDDGIIDNPSKIRKEKIAEYRRKIKEDKLKKESLEKERDNTNDTNTK